MRTCPFIYEINTAIWLSELARKHGHALDLGSVPAAEWDELASWGFDAVWLMGVWERSPQGAQIARDHPDLQRAYRSALPGYTLEDVAGSPYCIHRYIVDARFGGPSALQLARAELARRNMALILDFVPNHVALDHPWTREHPGYFIRDQEGHIANGRDPYFPPWTDTAQLNTFNPALRAALVATLQDIAAQCDGVRCDMAMLLLNEIVRKTWGDAAGPEPREEFWTQAIPAVKEHFPDFTFVAEVYWDLEAAMQQQGFDYSYDKRLYDRLAYEDAASVRAHLTAGIGYQSKLVRGIENHDEPRAAAVFSEEKERAAMVAVCTLPGAKLFHEGQLEGRKIKLPVQLARRPDEAVNESLRAFYRSLLQTCRDPLIRNGDWQLLEADANLLAWSRQDHDRRALIVINYSGQRSSGRVRVPWKNADSEAGLFLDLPAWGVNFLFGG